MFDFNCPENYKKVLNKSLRQLFSSKIKGNFLLEIMYNVIDNLGNKISKYYDLELPDNKKLVSANIELPFYDICRHIVGLHRSNLVFETEDERIKKESDEEYKNLLINQVIENIKLRDYGSAYFRKQAIVEGESFIFFHIPYNIFVLCLRMNELLTSYTTKDIYYTIFTTISNKGTAALSLLEDNFLDNAYPICRGIIELYIKLLLLLNCPETVTNAYYKFTEYELMQSCCNQNYPKEFNDLFENRKNKKCKNKIDYLHFGWLDLIDDFGVCGAQSYTLNGIIKYLKKKYGNQHSKLFDYLYSLYKICNGYTHGTTPVAKYPLLHYFEISIMLYYTIANTYIILCSRLKTDTKINNIDIINKLETDFNNLLTQYHSRSTANFENYYKLNKI